MYERDFIDKKVQKAFDTYHGEIRSVLLILREIIFSTAEEYSDVGEIEEALKWGNPSYLTNNPKSGTTVRLSQRRSNIEEFALSVHCQSTLISEFKQIYPELKYDGNRSIIFNIKETLPNNIVKHFIYLALTYHYRKKHGIGI